jgi:26S proteasome regulatory subunit N11
MLGEFVDDYTVRVVDVFAMPQSGTGVSVEAVDHVFQTNMLDMLKQTGRYGPPILIVDPLVLAFFPFL